MGALDSTLAEALTRAHRQAFVDAITEKLRHDGVELSPREQRQLSERLRDGGDGTFRIQRWPWWEKRTLAVELEPAEIRAISERFDEFLDGGLQKLVQASIEQLAPDIEKTLKRRWLTKHRARGRDVSAFEKRLRRLWGKGIDLLRMSITISGEFGQAVTNDLAADPEFELRAQLDVLARLHARACQVAEEVTCLLSSGFADGAVARWRTLHEIAVVAFFICSHDDDLAQRYLDHDVVESRRAAQEHQRFAARLNAEPIPESELAELDAAVEGLTARYGSAFKGHYGWAAEVLSTVEPKFVDIERVAQVDQFRPYYRMASHNVHANPKGILFKLGCSKGTTYSSPDPATRGYLSPVS